MKLRDSMYDNFIRCYGNVYCNGADMFLDSLERFLGKVHPHNEVVGLWVSHDFLETGKFKLQYEKSISFIATKPVDSKYKYTYDLSNGDITSP